MQREKFVTVCFGLPAINKLLASTTRPLNRLVLPVGLS